MRQLKKSQHLTGVTLRCESQYIEKLALFSSSTRNLHNQDFKNEALWYRSLGVLQLDNHGGYPSTFSLPKDDIQHAVMKSEISLILSPG